MQPMYKAKKFEKKISTKTYFSNNLHREKWESKRKEHTILVN